MLRQISITVTEWQDIFTCIYLHVIKCISESSDKTMKAGRNKKSPETVRSKQRIDRVTTDRAVFNCNEFEAKLNLILLNLR